MALAYTPGIKVKAYTTIKRIRRLPVKGKVMMAVGDIVNYDTEVARANMPGNVELLRIGKLLGIEPDEMPKCLLKKIGDTVAKDEIIARKTSLRGKKEARSPVSGTIERISPITGLLAIRLEPIIVQLKAYLPGKITQVIPDEGVEITTHGSYVQGIFGLGGETHGELMVIAEPDEEVTSEKIVSAHEGKILAGGEAISAETLRKAASLGVKGLIVGGIEVGELVEFMGHELGVAITGQENLGITLIITEGFGRMKIPARTYSLINQLQGKIASINGATQIRAGVIRPEIFVPASRELDKEFEGEDKTHLDRGMEPGMRVRIIRRPYLGTLGSIVTLPVELQNVQSESLVRVVEIELEDGKRVIVPRANVEILEE